MDGPGKDSLQERSRERRSDDGPEIKLYMTWQALDPFARILYSTYCIETWWPIARGCRSFQKPSDSVRETWRDSEGRQRSEASGDHWVGGPGQTQSTHLGRKRIGKSGPSIRCWRESPERIVLNLLPTGKRCQECLL